MLPFSVFFPPEKEIGKHSLALLCVSTSGQRKFLSSFYETLNTSLVADKLQAAGEDGTSWTIEAWSDECKYKCTTHSLPSRISAVSAARHMLDEIGEFSTLS